MITCRDLIERLDDYVDRQLGDRLRVAFEDHLAVCPDCVAYVESYRTTVAAVVAAYAGPGPIDRLPEELVKAILDARSLAR